MSRSGCCLTKLVRKFVWLLIIVLAVVWFFFYGGKKMLLRFFYPIEYEQYVEKYSGEYDLDKYLVYAVILTESKFDENAVSEAGAVGLMQIMEETAAYCNEKGKMGYSVPENLKDPETNIHIGCYYLSELIKEFKSTELALTSYNGGPGNVARWLENEEFSDGEGGLDITPYKETNDYVKKVLKSYKRYKSIY